MSLSSPKGQTTKEILALYPDLEADDVREALQFRGPGSRKPDVLAYALLSNLSQFSEALESGSIVTWNAHTSESEHGAKA